MSVWIRIVVYMARVQMFMGVTSKLEFNLFLICRFLIRWFNGVKKYAIGMSSVVSFLIKFCLLDKK